MNLNDDGPMDSLYQKNMYQTHAEQFPFPCNKERMNYVSTAVATVIFTVLFLVAYKLLVNPQIVLPASIKNMSMCPDRWNYNPVSQMCEPAYKTSCLPFNPSDQTLKSAAARCNLARTCGTSWGSFCG